MAHLRLVWAGIALSTALMGCGGGDDKGCSSGISGGLFGMSNQGSSDAACSTASGTFGQAADAFSQAVCGCLNLSIDECTDTTAAERNCQYQAANAATGDAATYRDCAVTEMKRVTECIRASSNCSAQVVSDCARAEDPIENACGAAPAAVEQIDAMCAGGGASAGDDGLAGSPMGGGGSEASDGVQCNDGSVIDPSWVCDGEADCAAGEDEDPQFCGASGLTCNDGTPIEMSWVCDGEIDCSGGEDEANCS